MKKSTANSLLKTALYRESITAEGSEPTPEAPATHLLIGNGHWLVAIHLIDWPPDLATSKAAKPGRHHSNPWDQEASLPSWTNVLPKPILTPTDALPLIPAVYRGFEVDALRFRIHNTKAVYTLAAPLANPNNSEQVAFFNKTYVDLLSDVGVEIALQDGDFDPTAAFPLIRSGLLVGVLMPIIDR